MKSFFPTFVRYFSILAFCLLCSMQLTMAEPVVLGKSSKIRPIEKALPDLLDRIIDEQSINTSDVKRSGSSVINQQAFKELLRDSLLRPSFPVTSSLQYSPNTTTQEVKAFLKTPLCIVGDDQGSIQWLTSNKPLLVKHDAVCAVAAAKSKQSLENLRTAAAPIAVVTIPLEEIAQRNNLKNYPVLIIGHEPRDFN